MIDLDAVAANDAGPLDRLRELTELMLHKAASGDWAALQELETMRSEQLDVCFAESRDARSGVSESELAELIALNDRVLTLVSAERMRVLDEHHDLTSQRALASRYGEHG